MYSHIRTSFSMIVSIRQTPSCKCHEVFSENFGDSQRYLQKFEEIVGVCQRRLETSLDQAFFHECCWEEVVQRFRQVIVILVDVLQKRNQLSEYIFVYIHNRLFKFGCKDTNSNPFAQFSTYNNLNFKIFKELFWFVQWTLMTSNI